MNALQQFLQAASNEAAGTISGPVDLIGMGLRKLGVPVPKNALMSSDWMRQNGLMQDVPQSGASLAGQTFGLLSPVVAAAKAPQIARGLLTMGENAAAPRRLNPQTGAIVYHGSPHKFDAFDSSKIGTGEGAQAYGHGLYLAEAPATASSYRGSVTKFDIPDGQLKGISTLIAARGDEGERLARQVYASDIPPDQMEAVIAQAKQVVDAQSSLYKVDLPDEKIARMLDWDKPLSQQSEAVRAAIDKIKAELTGPFSRDMTGDQLLMHIQSTLKGVGRGSEKAEGVLRAKGVPGIRYLDGGSRSAGAGSSNFVVFPGEENALRILERNGKPIR